MNRPELRVVVREWHFVPGRTYTVVFTNHCKDIRVTADPIGPFSHSLVSVDFVVRVEGSDSIVAYHPIPPEEVDHYMQVAIDICQVRFGITPEVWK